MNDDRWQQIDQLFAAALGRPIADRAAFLDQACGDDESLRRELESLLASHDEAKSFMAQPAIGEVAEMFIKRENRKLSKGQVVAHYEIISELGAGGQGAVYKTLDKKLGRTVALKLLPSELTVDEPSRKRFQREAQLASAIDHPNICTIHDLIEVDGTHGIVMQFVPGSNVRQLVNGRPLELKSALKIAIQVCDALAAAHAQGIIHRDIKAHNIIVTDQGQAKVLDFGLAKLTHEPAGGYEKTELTALGSPYGTPTYAAPEQSRGERVDHRADVFSVGVLLYEMFTGSWPFQGKTAVDVRHAVLHDEPKPVAAVRGEAIPGQLEKIVSRALAKDPDDRYQEMAALRDDLIAVLQALPASETSETAAFLEHLKPLAPRHLRRWGGPTKLLGVIAAGVCLLLAALLIYHFLHSRPPNARIQSIAVLPFKPLSANGDQYLELGMADALITRLSHVRQLKVRPTSSVLKYTATSDPVAAGRELNVDAVLDGRIQRDGDTLRITVQLINVSDGSALWFGKFDEDFKSIFAVQDSISERLVSELAMNLAAEERQLVTKRYTDNTAAYQAYLKGRYFWQKVSAPNLEKAIENFDDALKEDPNFAPAFAGLADSYEMQGYLNIKPSVEAFPKAKEAAGKALALDDNVGQAHLVLAKAKIFFDWDIRGAKQEIDRALALTPNDPDTHGFYGVYWVVTGELDKALAERKRMQELDPVSAFAAVSVGWSYFYKHDYDSAIAQYKKALELEPNFSVAQEALGTAYLCKGMSAEGVEAFLQEKAANGATAENVAVFKRAFTEGGIKGYWTKELEIALERLRSGHGSPRRLARIYTELGDKDQAFVWLDKAFAERSSLLIFLKTDPNLDPLRDDPRFPALMSRVGIP